MDPAFDAKVTAFRNAQYDRDISLHGSDMRNILTRARTNSQLARDQEPDIKDFQYMIQYFDAGIKQDLEALEQPGGNTEEIRRRVEDGIDLIKLWHDQGTAILRPLISVSFHSSTLILPSVIYVCWRDHADQRLRTLTCSNPALRLPWSPLKVFSTT